MNFLLSSFSHTNQRPIKRDFAQRNNALVTRTPNLQILKINHESQTIGIFY